MDNAVTRLPLQVRNGAGSWASNRAAKDKLAAAMGRQGGKQRKMASNRLQKGKFKYIAGYIYLGIMVVLWLL